MTLHIGLITEEIMTSFNTDENTAEFAINRLKKIRSGLYHERTFAASEGRSELAAGLSLAIMEINNEIRFLEMYLNNKEN